MKDLFREVETHMKHAVEHFQHEPVAIVAGLDPIDRIVERRREPLNVLEFSQACGERIGGDRESVFCADQIRAHHGHRTVFQVSTDVGLLGGHPIAEKNVDILILQGCECDRHRKHGDRGGIAYREQHLTRESSGRRDIGPAHVSEANSLAARRVSSGRRHCAGGGCE